MVPFSAYFDIRDNVLYGGSGLKSDYAGHSKRFHGNLGVALTLPCGVGTQYRAGHEDRCFNNTIILRSGNWRAYLPAHNSTQPYDQPWVNAWFCDTKQQGPPRCGQLGTPATGGPSVLAQVHSNTVLNMNGSIGDVQCGQEKLSAAAFKDKCGVDVGSVSARRPGLDEIEKLVRSWLGIPPLMRPSSSNSSHGWRGTRLKTDDQPATGAPAAMAMLLAALLADATAANQAQNYEPYRRTPELFSPEINVQWLHPAVREYFSGDGSATSLRALLREESEDVYSFPLFTPEFCEMFLDELDNFKSTGLPVRRPNSMNRYGTLTPANILPG